MKKILAITEIKLSDQLNIVLTFVYNDNNMYIIIGKRTR